MIDPIGLLEQNNLTGRNICKIFMETAELSPTKKDTDRMVKIPYSTYAKADLEQVSANTAQMNYYDIFKVLVISNALDELFYGTLG